VKQRVDDKQRTVNCWGKCAFWYCL